MIKSYYTKTQKVIKPASGFMTFFIIFPICERKGCAAMKQKIFPALLVGLVSGCVVLLAWFYFIWKPSHGDSASYPEYTHYIFNTPGDMVQHFAEQGQAKNSSSPEPNLFLLKDTIAGLKLDTVKVSGAFVYYRYDLEKSVEKVPQDSMQSERTQSVSSEPNEYNNEIQKQIDNGTYTIDDSYSGFDYISIGWNYNGKGGYGLDEFVKGNPKSVKKLDGYPGFYYSDCVTEQGTLFGKMLYWVQEDCFFQASVPIGVYEEALAEITAPALVIQRVNIDDIAG